MNPQGKLGLTAWFLVLLQAIAWLRGKDWSGAFASCGLAADGGGMSERRIRDVMGNAPLLNDEPQRPTVEEICMVLNKRTCPFYEHLVPKRQRVVVVLPDHSQSSPLPVQ